MASERITIPAGTVGSNLTAFVVMVRLRDLPSAFWSAVKVDGGDIRVKTTGGTALPFDLARFDHSLEDGVLYVRTDVSSGTDTEFDIHYGGSEELLAPGASGGRNDTWQDFHCVYLFGETPHDRTGNLGNLRQVTKPQFFEQTFAVNLGLNAHDGVAADGVNYYGFNGNHLRKYDGAWSFLIENTDPAGDSGITGANFLECGDVYDGVIYVPLDAGATDYIARYDASDLSFIGAFEAENHHSDLHYDPDEDIIYAVQYVGSPGDNKIHRYDNSDGSYLGSITLSENLINVQGIAKWRGAFWVTEGVGGGGRNAVLRVALDGTIEATCMFSNRDGTDTQGIAVDRDGDALLILSSSGTGDRVRRYRPWDPAPEFGGGAIHNGINLNDQGHAVGDLVSTGDLGSQWTVGATFDTPDNNEKVILALAETGAGDTANVHIRNVAGASLEVWDGDNGTLATDPTYNPTPGTPARVNVIYDGTNGRHIFVNGGSKNSDLTITARGAGISHIVPGNRAESEGADRLNAPMGYVYARKEVLSDDWIAAESTNLRNPLGFYTVGTVPAGAHRHWRVNVSASEGGSSNISIMHLEMYESAYGKNVAQLGDVSASSAFAGAEAFKAVEHSFRDAFQQGGSVSDFWGAQSPDDEWIAVDFGAGEGNKRVIVAVGIMARAFTDSAPEDFTVEWADADSPGPGDWTVAWTVSGETGWGVREYRRFISPGSDPGSSDHGTHPLWRLFAVPVSEIEVALAEAEFRAAPGAADQADAGVATASSIWDASFPARNAFDNVLSTLWSSANNSYTAWLQYEFPAPVDVYEVAITSRHDGIPSVAVGSALVQWSDTGEDWTTAWGIFGQTGWTSSEERVFTDPNYGEPPVTPPSTPTVTIDAVGEHSVDASTSAFVAGEGGSHTHTQWQITTAADTGFASPVYDPGDDASNLTTIDGAGSGVPLEAGTDYLIRARHKEDDTTYSEWSTGVAFTTFTNTGIRYVPITAGEYITIAAHFVKENGAADDSAMTVYCLRHAADKTELTPRITALQWGTTADSGRKQGVLKPWLGVANDIRFVSFRFTAEGNTGQTAGFDWIEAWRGSPDFGLTATLSLDGSNVDLEWESLLPCRVKYVANDTGYVSSANVEANGTFTNASELTSDTEEDVIASLSGTAYVTLVPFDEDGRRSGGRYLVPTITN